MTNEGKCRCSLQVYPTAAPRRASGADKGKAIAVESSSESDADAVEPDDADSFARSFSTEDALRDEAQYWVDAALARHLAAEEVAAAGLDVSLGDTVLKTMQSEHLLRSGAIAEAPHVTQRPTRRALSGGVVVALFPYPRLMGAVAVVRPLRLGLRGSVDWAPQVT